MECIGCTACIDACDDIMTRLKRPQGLIRYDSQKAFTGSRTRWLRPRTILYGMLLLIGASVATWALSTVRPANFGVTRMTGAPYVIDAVSVRNQFLVRIVNKRNEPARFLVLPRVVATVVMMICLTVVADPQLPAWIRTELEDFAPRVVDLYARLGEVYETRLTDVPNATIAFRRIFDGLDKTTKARRLVRRLESLGFRVDLTEESAEVA